jgi:hypothetical protein
MAAMAADASPGLTYVMKAKPRDTLESRSRITCVYKKAGQQAHMPAVEQAGRQQSACVKVSIGGRV